jgi:putative transposase
LHGGADHGGQRLARGDPGPPGPHHRGRSDAQSGTRSGAAAVPCAAADALHVADFTYAPMAGGGFGYTAFVIDAYAGLIAGWECSLTKNTAFVERAIRGAAARRAREGHPLSGATIHHSDAGSQYTAIHFTETLMLAGLIPSVGTVGDALDNALAETTIGLYKTECVREDSPFRNGPTRTLADLEDITSAWVAWYNASRLMHRLGRRPPAEAEAEYYAHLQVGQHTDHT